MRIKRKKLEQGTDSGILAVVGHGAQRGYHVQIFLAGKIRIEIGFFRNVAEPFAIGRQILVDVLAVVSDLAVGGFQQADEHFYRGAFSRAIGAQVAKNLPRLESEGYILNGGNGAIKFE